MCQQKGNLTRMVSQLYYYEKKKDKMLRVMTNGPPVTYVTRSYTVSE